MCSCVKSGFFIWMSGGHIRTIQNVALLKTWCNIDCKFYFGPVWSESYYKVSMSWRYMDSVDDDSYCNQIENWAMITRDLDFLYITSHFIQSLTSSITLQVRLYSLCGPAALHPKLGSYILVVDVWETFWLHSWVGVFFYIFRSLLPTLTTKVQLLRLCEFALRVWVI